MFFLIQCLRTIQDKEMPAAEEALHNSFCCVLSTGPGSRGASSYILFKLQITVSPQMPLYCNTLIGWQCFTVRFTFQHTVWSTIKTAESTKASYHMALIIRDAHAQGFPQTQNNFHVFFFFHLSSISHV